MNRRLILVVTALALGGCGARQDLKPAEGASLPPPAYGGNTSEARDADSLLQPPVQTRPARSDNLIESADQRRSDKFDLPPN